MAACVSTIVEDVSNVGDSIDSYSFRPDFGHACGLRFFAEAFLAEVVVFECVAAAHVVLADFSGDFRGFVFEEAVEVHNPVIDTVALTDAFNSGLVCFVIEGLLADAVVLLRRSR